MSRPRIGLIDLLLVLIVTAWGTNLSVIKVALREFPVHTFNFLRMIVAAGAFTYVLARLPREARMVQRGDVGRVVFLGLVGGSLYQWIFVTGVPMTSVANSGLIFGLSPVVISIFSSFVGHERLPWMRWAGGLVSLVGLYFVVGSGAGVSSTSIIGDALVFTAMVCWAIYSVASRPLLGRYSPTMLTAWASLIATPTYLPIALPSLLTTNWSQISWWTWGLMLWSSLFCLVLAYVVWYTGVQVLGATRTSAYSNLTPIVAIVVGWLWLGEPVSAGQLVGAAAILGGVFLTRMSSVELVPHADEGPASA